MGKHPESRRCRYSDTYKRKQTNRRIMMRKDYDPVAAPLAATAKHETMEDGMKQDRSPLTFRQQGTIAAALGAAMLVFYTLLGMV
jgi:hypothetical protein